MTKSKDDRAVTTLSREQLLELQLLNQKAHRILAQLEAVNQRKAAISMEMNIIVEKEKELQTQRDAMLAHLRESYNKAKVQANVPEGMELDIETGEAVTPPQAPAQQ
jgi:hypothetical protein